MRRPAATAKCCRGPPRTSPAGSDSRRSGEPLEPAEVAAPEVSPAEVAAEVTAVAEVPGVGGVGIAGISAVACVGFTVAGTGVSGRIAVEEGLRDRRADEARSERRQEEAPETRGVPAGTPDPLDRARLADLGPGHGPGERRRIVAADLARRHDSAERLERLPALVRGELRERLLVRPLDVLGRRRRK